MDLILSFLMLAAVAKQPSATPTETPTPSSATKCCICYGGTVDYCLVKNPTLGVEACLDNFGRYGYGFAALQGLCAQKCRSIGCSGGQVGVYPLNTCAVGCSGFQPNPNPIFPPTFTPTPKHGHHHG